MLQSTAPLIFSSFAVVRATFLYNRSLHSGNDDKTLFLLRYKVSENSKRLVPFRCRVEIYLPKENRTKLDNTTRPGVMLG